MANLVDQNFSKGLLVLLACFFLSWIVYRLSKPILRWTIPTASGMIGNLLRYGVVTGGLILALQEAKASQAQIWTIVAVFSAALVLALESSARDLLSGIKLLIFGIYRNGDLVTIGEYQGQVIEITDSFTRLEERWTHSIVYIRNSDVLESTVINHSRNPIETLVLTVPVMSVDGQILRAIQTIELAVRSFERFRESRLSVHYDVEGSQEVFRVFVPEILKLTRDETKSVLLSSISTALVRTGIRVGGRCGD